MRPRIFAGLILFAVLLLFFFIALSCHSKPVSPQRPEKNKSISILWAEWAPAHYLRQLTEDFTRETGIEVIIKTVPFEIWQKTTFDELDRHGTAYDLVVGDSQWLGRGSVNGHYIDLTNWINENHVGDTMTAASMSGYAEFPKGSGKYWAIPIEGDAKGWTYRKDKFEDPVEQKKFFEKYGYKLDVPQTWAQLRDIAEFFYRPHEGFYGLAVITENQYDGITMGFENVLFAWGAEWGTPDYHVRGILNSPEGIEALEFYKSLYNFCPPTGKRLSGTM